MHKEKLAVFILIINEREKKYLGVINRIEEDLETCIETTFSK